MKMGSLVTQKNPRIKKTTRCFETPYIEKKHGEHGDLETEWARSAKTRNENLNKVGFVWKRGPKRRSRFQRRRRIKDLLHTVGDNLFK